MTHKRTHSDISNVWIRIKLFRCVYVYACNRIVYNKWNSGKFAILAGEQWKSQTFEFRMHSQRFSTLLIWSAIIHIKIDSSRIAEVEEWEKKTETDFGCSIVCSIENRLIVYIGQVKWTAFNMFILNIENANYLKDFQGATIRPTGRTRSGYGRFVCFASCSLISFTPKCDLWSNIITSALKRIKCGITNNRSPRAIRNSYRFCVSKAYRKSMLLSGTCMYLYIVHKIRIWIWIWFLCVLSLESGTLTLPPSLTHSLVRSLAHQMSKDMYAHVHKHNAHYKRIRNAGSVCMPPIYRGVK